MLESVYIMRRSVQNMRGCPWSDSPSCGCIYLRLFEILVQPAEELAIPYYAVLWLEYLVRLVLE